MRRSNKGFTLLEVLVATAIMGVAIAGLLNAIAASSRNASRLGQYDRAVLLAKSKMDELLAEPKLQRNIPMVGEFSGTPCTWRAIITPFEHPPGTGAGYWDVDRIELEIDWLDGSTKHAFALEGFRRGTLVAGDVPPVPHEEAKRLYADRADDLHHLGRRARDRHDDGDAHQPVVA